MTFLYDLSRFLIDIIQIHQFVQLFSLILVSFLEVDDVPVEPYVGQLDAIHEG